MGRALIGVATGVLLYLFFDLMHEAVELSGARDVLSWIVFLGSLALPGRGRRKVRVGL